MYFHSLYDRHYLKAHSIISKKKVFKCTHKDADGSRCRYRTNRKGDLNRHINSFHTENKPKFYCPHCGAEFSRKDSVPRHLKKCGPNVQSSSAIVNSDSETDSMDSE